MVDTGIHALGWSRDRALAFLQDHTGLAKDSVEVRDSDADSKWLFTNKFGISEYVHDVW